LCISWNQVGDTILNDDCGILFGYFVRLTHDGELLVACRGGSAGNVYYYEKQGMGNDYVLQQSIGFDNIVGSIAVDGNAMVVSEYRSGRSYVIHFFERKNHVWEEVNRIDDTGLDEYFGRGGVALFGNTTLIASRMNVYPLEDYFSSSTPSHTTPISTPPPSTMPTEAPSSLFLYYPDWNKFHCNNDPSSSSTSIGITFHKTVEECCEKWFSWQQDECILNSP